ncbi:polysaccharide deacetylase family protein [Kribbella sp. NPDC051587]|uniref:polysaccharide deacetylase family protein n=1 Tax=Kribbella sp. NPDC051587 TaxID=3364119 RepID=UPI0037A73358
MNVIPRRTFLGFAIAAGVTGCADTGPDPTPVVVEQQAAPPSRPTAKPGKPDKAKPPFTGLVPVLMHHRLVRADAGSYDMTPQFFRAELDRLRRESYYPIRTIDLARGNFTAVPAGKRPVVLTFDDSSPGQFAVDAGGTVHPASALGMMLDFHADHPDFPAIASFYITKNPFGYHGPEAVRALRKLAELGCEIGNHTLSHPNLHTLTDAEVQAEIGGLSGLVTAAGLPAPRTLALPLGVHPRNRSLLAHGGSGRTAYRNEAVLLVGANPSRSPQGKGFDPMAIPRIRCSSHDGGRADLELNYWLDRLKGGLH